MAEHTTGVSEKTDQLSSTLLGIALDLVAEGQNMGVLLAVEDAHNTVASYEFLNDGEVACLDAAREKVGLLQRAGGDSEAGLSKPVRYALIYDGAIEVDDGEYADALLFEFGEKGWPAWSAYCCYEGKGQQENFAWANPAPAGEVDNLLY